MCLLAIIHDPREITRRESRIEKAMKARRSRERHARENFFDADDPLMILIQSEIARHA